MLPLMPDTCKCQYLFLCEYYQTHALVFCRSKTIHNDTITCCGDHIREKILTEVRNTKYFWILANEVAGV